MSSRCRALLFLACLSFIAADPASKPEDKPSLADLMDPRPARAFVRLGTPRLQQQLGTVAAFSPNGKLLALHDSLWDVDSGKKLRDLRMPEVIFGPFALTFSPDGKWIAGQCNHSVVLWETATGKQLRAFSSREGDDSVSFHSLAFSPDGKQLATGVYHNAASKSSPILVWDPTTGRQLRRLAGRATLARQLAFSDDGKRLVSLHVDSSDPINVPRRAADGSLVVWDVTDGKPLLERTKIRPGVLCADGRLCTIQGEDGRIQIHDLEKRRLLRTLEMRDFHHVFSPDGKLLASVDKQNVARLWEVGSGRLLKQMKGRWRQQGEEQTAYLSFAFSPDNKFLLTGSYDSGNNWGPLHLWDVAKGEERLPAEDHFAAVTCLAFSADSKTLISGGADHVLHQWDTASRRHVRRFAGHGDIVDTVALSLNGRLLASSGHDKRLRLWDSQTGRQLHALDAPANFPLSLTFLADGKTLQWWGPDGKLHRYDAVSGKRLQTMRSRRGLHNATPLGADGLAAPTSFRAGEDVAWLDDLWPNKLRTMRFLDDASSETRACHPRYVRVSPDGRMVAAVEMVSLGGLAGPQCRIGVWELATGSLIADLGMTSGIWCLLAFSRDGWGLFSAAKLDFSFGEGRLQGWDLLRGKSVHRLKAPWSEVTCLAMSPDGAKLAAGHEDGLMSVWEVDGLFQPPAAPPLSAAELQRLGDCLRETNAGNAYRAMHRLARSPEQSIPFLRERLRKFVPAPPPRLRQLIADLDDSEFAVREKASRELERLGSSAEAALRRVQEKPPSPEVRRRVGALLEKLNDEERRRATLQVLRGITVLERIGTAAARAVLRELAATPDSDVGTEAEAALHRLEPQPIPRSRRD